MKRLLGRQIWIGLTAALLALLFIGVPLLMITLQTDACIQFPGQCGGTDHGFEFALGAAVVAFFLVWWATARSVRWWTGDQD
jgi:hypothetical protein